MLVGILAVPIVAVMLIGTGNIVPNLMNSIKTDGLAASAPQFLDIFYDGDKRISFINILSQLSWGLGYCGMPHILVRFMAIRDEKELGKSKKIAIVWVLLSLFVACVIGVVGRAYLDPAVLDATSSENVYIEMIKKIFMEDTRLPLIGGILLCGILAAIMSTADSQLLVSSSAVSKDLCKGVMFKNMSDKQVLLVSRITVFAVALIAYFIAWNPDSSIMGLVSDAWAGLGSAFGPTILLSLYWKRINLYGAAAGMISGGVTVIIWDYIKCMKLDGEMVTPATYTGLYSLLVGFVISIVVIILVSLLTPKVDDEILQAFDDVKNGAVE
jgi:sodium/proline symporter